MAAENAEGGTPFPDAKSREIQAVLVSTLGKHNETLPQNRKIIYNDRATVLDVRVPLNGVNDQLLLVAKTTKGLLYEPQESNTPETPPIINTFQIGHFDRALDRFMYYDEVIEEREAVTLDPLARHLRAETVKKNSDLDSDHPEVIDILQRHRQFLLQEDIVDELEQNFRVFMPQREIQDPPGGIHELMTDNATSFYISLSNSTRSTVAIEIQGDLRKDDEGEWRRRTRPVPIKIGHQDEKGTLQPEMKIMAIIGKSMHRTLLDFAEELRDLRTTKPFDSELVAFEKPSTPNPLLNQDVTFALELMTAEHQTGKYAPRTRPK